MGHSELEIINGFIGQTEQQKEAFFIEMLKDVKYQRVRDFLVSEPPKNFDVLSLIIHVPSGMWKGFDMPYIEALQEILSYSPEKDEKMVQLLFEC